MLTVSAIHDWLVHYTDDEDFFIVDVRMPRGDEVSVEVDRDGGISSDECGTICRELSQWIDAQGYNVEITVSSPGLTTPMRTPRQFMKNVGRSVEVLQADGVKVSGGLLWANLEEFAVEVSEKRRLEGEKRPRTVTHEAVWRYEDVKHVKLIIGKR